MRLLLTAFEPYGPWDTNSSWEALVAYVSENGVASHLVTRRYPVDLDQLKPRLEKDLSQGIDAVLHLGQSPTATDIKLEAFALNVAGIEPNRLGEYDPIIPDGPQAYRTSFPLGLWQRELQAFRISASISYHAGTYLCNRRYVFVTPLVR